MEIRIDDNYLSELLANLVNIPSEFPDEEAIMLFLEKELASLGFSPKRYVMEGRRFNLLARTGEGGPILCLNAHSDTVPRCDTSLPSARMENGRMYGLGSDDDKASVAAIIAAVKAVRESGVKLSGTLDLLISVDEEGQAEGVLSAIDGGYRCDMAIVGEPSELEVIPCHCGIAFLELVTRGVSTHGSTPWNGVNAIRLMYDLVSKVEAVTDYPAHPMIGRPSMNLGIIGGGDRPNRVPDECRACIDIRLVPPMTVKGILDRVDACVADFNGQAEYRVLRTHGTLDTPPDAPLVRQVVETGEGVSGKPLAVNGWRGWTEAESFASRLGIPAVVMGPGALKQAHSSVEFVEMDQVRKAARIYAEAALRILG